MNIIDLLFNIASPRTKYITSTTGSIKKISFQSLRDAVLNTGASFVTSFMIKPNDTITVCMTESVDKIIIILSLLAYGITVDMVDNVSVDTHEGKILITDANASALIIMNNISGNEACQLYDYDPNSVLTAIITSRSKITYTSLDTMIKCSANIHCNVPAIDAFISIYQNVSYDI